jgi:hypothetical protein
MKLDTFLLADAVAAHDRKLFVHGGGVSRIAVPEFPFTQPQIALLARFAPEKDEEISEKHTFGLRLVNPDGQELYPIAEMAVGVDPKKDHVEGEEVYLNLAVQAGPIQLHGPGIYRVEIYLDGEMMRSAALPAVLEERPGLHKIVARQSE